jgi:hypothetical protein
MAIGDPIAIRRPHAFLRQPLALTLFAVALAAIWAATSFVMGQSARSSPVLRIVSTDGAELLRIALDEGLNWEIHWLHSVADVVVRDHFAWSEGQMILTDSLTPLLDIAGLGHTPGRGEMRNDGAGGTWIADINEPIPGNAYWMRIGSARAPTTLVYGDRAYPLSVDHPSLRIKIEVIEP